LSGSIALTQSHYFRKYGRSNSGSAKYVMLIVPSTKGSCFENITDDEIESMMNELNHRPRKTLNFKTPHAVFFAELLQEVV